VRQADANNQYAASGRILCSRQVSGRMMHNLPEI